MSRLSKHHIELGADGVGKCGTPMWWGHGAPAGLCDKAAYGKGQYVSAKGDVREAHALACPEHGGPDSRVFMDGNMWCAVYPDFVNLQESPAGFGPTPEDARAKLTEEAVSNE